LTSETLKECFFIDPNSHVSLLDSFSCNAYVLFIQTFHWKGWLKINLILFVGMGAAGGLVYNQSSSLSTDSEAPSKASFDPAQFKAFKVNPTHWQHSGGEEGVIFTSGTTKLFLFFM
jgi:hypothetical protein